MRFFFFGSLMDRDVAAVVLGRSVQPADLVVATLSGYARVVVAEESYPALVGRPDGQVDGVLLEGLDEVEVARMQFFESAEFAPTELSVVLDTGERVEAWVFAGEDDVIEVTDEHWDFVRWQRQDKQDYLELTRVWMAQFGERSAAELEADWSTGRARQAGDPQLTAATTTGER